MAVSTLLIAVVKTSSLSVTYKMSLVYPLKEREALAVTTISTRSQSSLQVGFVMPQINR